MLTVSSSTRVCISDEGTRNGGILGSTAAGHRLMSYGTGGSTSLHVERSRRQSPGGPVEGRGDCYGKIWPVKQIADWGFVIGLKVGGR